LALLGWLVPRVKDTEKEVEVVEVEVCQEV
jgi:hypothetical protein